jgi:hypothetical protein
VIRGLALDRRRFFVQAGGGASFPPTFPGGGDGGRGSAVLFHSRPIDLPPGLHQFSAELSAARGDAGAQYVVCGRKRAINP